MNNRPSSSPKKIFTFDVKQWLLPVFVLVLIQLAVMIGLFSHTEMSLYDSWFRLRGAQNPGEEVVIVAIDQSSINRIGPPAWSREVHAQLLDKLQEARAVGFDLTFAAEKDPAEDQAFADAIATHPGAVLGFKFYFEKDADGNPVQIFEPPASPLLDASQGRLGFVNTPTDSDQTIRHYTLVDTNYANMPIPSLGMAVALQAEDLSPADLTVKPGCLRIGKKEIPIDNQTNQAMPTFWGPKGTFKTLSYADVLEEKISPNYFKDKIVLVGTVCQEDHDDYPTPHSTSNLIKSGTQRTPGVEIHASMVQSFLADSWYQKANAEMNFLFLLLLVLLSSLLVRKRSPWVGLLATLGLVILTCGITYLFWNAHWWLNLAAPLAIVLLSYVVITAQDFIVAEMGRRKTRAMFSRYVSADVVEELMNNPDDVSLGGKKQVLSIMFCDIRGFTAYSENKDPEDVIRRLNEYLTGMTDIIFKHGGTLDKYLGDGLMAFFGAPVFYEDHIERAIQVAIEIQEEVDRLNQKWADEGAVPLKVAVGINTGPAVVGNVGSPERMDYTLIGEDVNLASRVEALSKIFEVLIVVSERSYNLLPEGELKESLYLLGAEQVKGFTHPISCYSVSGLDLSFQRSTDKGFK